MEEKYKIHSFYILLILSAIIIVLITIKWAEIPKFADYVTFALSVTSLSLAFLAIIYSIYSNTSFTQNLSTLERSTTLLTSTSTDLSIATADLKSKVEDIPGIIKTVSEKVDQTHDLISNMSTLSVPKSANVGNANEIPDGVLLRIPEQTGQPFHGKLDTDSTANWTLIPRQTGH